MAKLTKEWAFGKDINAFILRLVLGLSMLYVYGLSKWNFLFGEGEIKFAEPFGRIELPLIYFSGFIFQDLFLCYLLDPDDFH